MIDRRRIMLKEAAATPGGPLYAFEDIEYSYSSRHIWITNGNHIKYQTSANSRAVWFDWEQATSGWLAADVPLFSITEGDVGVVKAKNIVYSGNTVQSNIVVGLRKTSANEGVNISTGTFYLPTGQTTIADVTNESQSTYTGGIGCFYMSAYRAVTVEFDFELYINGIRYV